jgi:molybdate transport system substrate-binding protein
LKRIASLLGLTLVLSGTASADEAPVRLYAAGTLSAAMTEIAGAFSANGGSAVTTVFGASGLLRERIERGEGADVFASADVGNPEALTRAGKADAPIVFARNRLCAVAAPGVEVTTDTLLDRMLAPGIKLGTSTPKADPSGDYAWQVFEKAEKVRPGSFATLDAKALKLTGGPQSPQAPPGRSIYAFLIGERKADIFLTYCTNAMQVTREVSGSRMLALPEPLAVGASYALTVVNPVRLPAARLALFVMSRQAQEILTRYGFTAVATP